MEMGNELSLLEFLAFGLAFHLGINGILIGIKERKVISSLFYGVSSIFLSFILSYKIIHTSALLQEIIALLIWPLVYVYILSHQLTFKLRWVFILHVCIPLAWWAIHQFQLLPQIEGIFDLIYLSSMIGYGWLSIYEVSKLQKALQWNNRYLNVLFYGLILAISFRILLPVIFQHTESHAFYFHVVLGIFFVLLSGFYFKSPIRDLHERVAFIQKDETLNYEEELKRKLRNAMVKDKLFLDPDLTLHNLGDKLGIKPVALSNFINNNLGKNFNDFVNGYRVEEVKQLMVSPSADPQATIMEQAYQAGFNSKATFNRIFKQFTQMTPTQYKRLKQSTKR